MTPRGGLLHTSQMTSPSIYGRESQSRTSIAYLYSGNGATHVYGFNGKHLGWFDKGLIRDSEGDAACGVKSVIRLPQIEPIKSIKEIKPIKSIREIPPIKPISSMTWGDVPCSILLALGGDD